MLGNLHCVCHGFCGSSDAPSTATPFVLAERTSYGWHEEELVPSAPRQVESLLEPDIVNYATGLHYPVLGPPVRSGEVWHLHAQSGKRFQKGLFSLCLNGFTLSPTSGKGFEGDELSISWSPFSLVQSCRLHTVDADKSRPNLRLFRVSIFSHSWSHILAVEGKNADQDRARWVAEIARVLRLLTQSLFPEFSHSVEPLPMAQWTITRILAGYLLLCHDTGTLLLYCELHAHRDCVASFNVYADERCTSQLMTMNIKVTTKVSEVVGVDCSCFSINGKHFSARTCAEKMLWLRAISNIKVKLEHQRENPTPTDIMHYREAILESARSLEERYGSSRLFPLSSRRVTRRPSAASEAALMSATEANRQEVSSNEELNDTLREPDMVGEALHPDGVVTLTELGPATRFLGRPVEGAQHEMLRGVETVCKGASCLTTNQTQDVEQEFVAAHHVCGTEDLGTKCESGLAGFVEPADRKSVV